MKNKKHIYQLSIVNCQLALALTLLLVAGCQKEDSSDVGNEQEVPIAFSTELSGDDGTRAASVPLYYFQKSIKLYGTKTVAKSLYESGASGDTTVSIFPQYRLQYVDDTKSWEYESGKHTDIPTGQIAKYWDNDATAYAFVGGAPYSHTVMDNANQKFILTGLHAEATSASGSIATAYLFCYPTLVKKGSDGKFPSKVTLTFYLAMTRIRLAFYYETAPTNDVQLTDIQFGPATGNSFLTAADLQLTTDNTDPEYPKSAWTPVEGTSTSQTSPLDFENITIESATATDYTKNYVKEVYYMIPQVNTSDWVLTIGGLTGKNKATVAQEHMKWEPCKQYTYKFKITSSEIDQSIKFVDCVSTAITDWDSGEDKTYTVYNW